VPRSIFGATARRYGGRSWRRVATALTTAAVTGAGVIAGAGTAVAEPATPAVATPAATRAALDPSLVAGRGATVDFSEQEAENASTNGTVIGPGRSAYTLPAEASGRKAVSLTPGQYVEFTLPSAANAITVRYSIPDAPNGGGITAPLDVTVNGAHRKSMTLTSQYAWLYNPRRRRCPPCCRLRLCRGRGTAARHCRGDPS
jgi:hypothetical protein